MTGVFVQTGVWPPDLTGTSDPTSAAVAEHHSTFRGSVPNGLVSLKSSVNSASTVCLSSSLFCVNSEE